MNAPAAQRVTIWTDGACSGNPGPGGWGAVLTFGQHEKEVFGGEAQTTNNRMELTAAIMALEGLKRPCVVDVHTDSQYVRGGVTGWMDRWKRNGWRTAEKSPVKNVDLWQRLDAAMGHHDIRWHWVRGHAGDTMNERADALARQGMQPFLKTRRPRQARSPSKDLAGSAKGRPHPPSHLGKRDGGGKPRI